MCSTTRSCLTLVLGVLLAATATAQSSSKKSPQRVSGPITITANSGEWQDGNMIYTGNVVMISKTLELRGARLELQQSGGKKSPYVITVTGSPATLKHMGQTAQDPVVNGNSKTMVYRSATQNIQLTGNAHLDRAKDELNGEDIKYDVASRRVQASGGEKGQVRIVIDVPEQDQ